MTPQQRRSRSTSPAVRPAPTKLGPYDQLKQAILTGQFPPGSPLVEQSIAQLYGVSRTPIREALRRLEQDGLVDRTMHGVIVRQRSPEEILDLYDTRIIVESAAGRVAAERRTDHDLRELRWKLKYGDEVAADDPDALVAANNELHQAVWRATHNESLIDLLERLSLHVARYPETTLAAPGRWETAVVEHHQLVDAIERRDGDEAARIAHRHFTEAREIRLALFERDSAPSP